MTRLYIPISGVIVCITDEVSVGLMGLAAALQPPTLIIQKQKMVKLLAVIKNVASKKEGSSN